MYSLKEDLQSAMLMAGHMAVHFPVAITDPSPALRSGHLRNANAEGESEDSDDDAGEVLEGPLRGVVPVPVHVVDYAHVYRKTNDRGGLTDSQREFLRYAFEQVNRAPSAAAAKLIAQAATNELAAGDGVVVIVLLVLLSRIANNRCTEWCLLVVSRRG